MSLDNVASSITLSNFTVGRLYRQKKSEAGLTLGDFFVRRRLFRGRAILMVGRSCLLVFTSGDSILANRRTY